MPRRIQDLYATERRIAAASQSGDRESAKARRMANALSSAGTDMGRDPVELLERIGHQGEYVVSEDERVHGLSTLRDNGLVQHDPQTYMASGLVRYTLTRLGRRTYDRLRAMELLRGRNGGHTAQSDLLKFVGQDP